jgi:branched-chain amino acid transport system permease protein
VAAAALGISVFRIRVLTFALGGAMAGLAGGVSAHYTLVVSPVELGFFPSFSILVFVLVGGSYTPVGAIVGAVDLTLVPQIFRFADELRFALYGLAIVLVVLNRPEGLVSRPILAKLWAALPNRRHATTKVGVNEGHPE